MEFLPNKYIIQKENIYEKMDSLLLKYLDCSGKNPYQQSGKHEKIFKIFVFKEEFTLHNTHRNSKI